MQNKKLIICICLIFIFSFFLSLKNQIWNPLVKFDIYTTIFQGNVTLDEDFNFELGSRIPIKYVTSQNTYKKIYDNYNFACLDVIWRNCSYSIGVDWTGKIIYIETKDKYPLPSESGYYYNDIFVTSNNIGFSTNICDIPTSELNMITENYYFSPVSNWYIVTENLDGKIIPKKFIKKSFVQERDTDFLEDCSYIVYKLLNYIWVPSIIVILVLWILIKVVKNRKYINRICFSIIIGLLICNSILFLLNFFLYKWLYEYFLLF